MSKPKLSISLLSSGRGNTIERCLSSLQLFKEVFETEIIVVDTDPDHRESVHTVLEKYADRIIPFEWINDFSAARNAGMKECTGEWFMFIDDDEWFMDAAPLIDFLKSEESKKYHWVNIICRNYADPEFKTWGDNWVSRLIRLKKDTRFAGIVHEYFEPLTGDAKPVRAMLGHTGYIYLTEEQKQQHAHRNISLLEKAVEKRESEMRWWLQLVQEYDAIGNKVKIREASSHCVEMLQKYDSDNAREMKGYFTAALMRVDRQEKRWEEEKKTWEAYGKKRGFTEVADTYLDLECALLFNNLEDFDKAREYIHSYFDRYERLKDRTDEFSNISYHFLANTFDESLWGMALSMMIYLDIKAGDFSSFEQYFDRLRWKDGAPYDFRAYARLFIAQMSQMEFDEHFVQMAKVFWGSEVVRRIILDVLQQTMQTKDASFWRIIRIFSDEQIQNPSPWDLRILNADHEDTPEFDYMLYYREMYQQINPFLVDQDIWGIAEKRGVDLASVIRSVPFSKWQRNVDYYLANSDVDVKEYLLKYIESLPLGRDPHLLYFTKGTREDILIEQAKEKENVQVSVYYRYQQLRSELLKLCIDSLTFYRRLYKPELFEENSELLPSECQLMIRLDQALMLDEGSYREILSGLKAAIGIYPEFDEVINQYSHLYADSVKDGSVLHSITDEMRQLSAALMEKASELKVLGQYDAAEAIYRQLESIGVKRD